MALLGISLLVASVVYAVIRPPAWLAHRLPRWLDVIARRGAITNSAVAASDAPEEPQHDGFGDDQPVPTGEKTEPPAPRDRDNAAALAMPPPPLPPAIRRPAPRQPDSPTTPKATPMPSANTVPSLSLSDGPPAAATMPPPPRPPTLPQFPAASSAQRARGPAPDRRSAYAAAPAGGLAPPPTHSSRPQKPARKVTLDPGRSPLDWARISGPNADLRGLDPSTPYLRVTPSMLKRQTGRKGTDAWMALNGRVYNVTPYAEYHPGGIPELMRGAGRDGTRLFGEIHPWVNYEAMLSACLVGLLVEEPEEGSRRESDMDQMD